MKSLIIMLSLLTITSCSKSEGNNQIENSIYGTWQLIATYGNDGGNSPQWNAVNNGYTYTFNTDRSFTSNRFTECSAGIYELTSSTLVLKYNCSGFNTGIENPPGTFVEIYAFENTELILTPSYLNCDEGCSNKFKKIN